MKTKEMKGITLVALVITIVVLLILAGVSINTVLGDDGIIKKAKEAAEATKQASAEEEMNRLVLEYQLASNDETLESFLQEKVTEGRIDGVTDNGDGTITITKKVEGKDYTITGHRIGGVPGWRSAPWKRTRYQNGTESHPVG